MASMKHKVEELCDDIDNYLFRLKENKKQRKIDLMRANQAVKMKQVMLMAKSSNDLDFNPEKSLRMSPAGNTKKYNNLRLKVDALKTKLTKNKHHEYCLLEDELKTKQKLIKNHEEDLRKLSKNLAIPERSISTLPNSVRNVYDGGARRDVFNAIKEAKEAFFKLRFDTREQEKLQLHKHQEIVDLSERIKFWEDKVKQKQSEIKHCSILNITNLRSSSENKNLSKSFEIPQNSSLRAQSKQLHEGNRELKYWRYKRAKIRKSIESHKCNKAGQSRMDMRINIVSNKINELERQLYETPRNCEVYPITTHHSDYRGLKNGIS
ncbi:unnamed protein product [Moneuplotes crassus]|uniref:Uncharacterized protein n=1 Tax=Euplotes crassus TaxID=5936 RepID=A0AAD1UES4_EUPCR|nr:unnamed protein product [Moneuplotes crassus]